MNDATKTANSLAAFLPKTNSASRTVDVDFKGVKFTIRHLTRAQLQAIAQQCTIMSYDSTARTKVPKLDLPRISKALAHAIVANWSNATLSTLQALMVLEIPEGTPQEVLDEPFPFTEENVELVFAGASGLEDFLQEASVDPNNFRSVPAAELAKN